MQADYDNFVSADGDLLRVKLAVSVGKSQIHYIGNGEYKTFDITGEAITDVNEAQNNCKAGSVVLSKDAWDMCDQDTYTSQPLEDDCVQVHVKFTLHIYTCIYI